MSFSIIGAASYHVDVTRRIKAPSARPFVIGQRTLADATMLFGVDSSPLGRRGKAATAIETRSATRRVRQSLGSEVSRRYTGAIDVLGAYSRFCALRDNESAWCWGVSPIGVADNYGVPAVVQLGAVNDGASNDIFSPRLLSSDGTYYVGGQAKSVDCGEF